MKMTVVYITGRKEPCLDWVVEDLDRQLGDKDEVQLVVVDALARSQAALGIGGKTRLQGIVVTPPKPNVWQGRHRVTSVDWWANSNARNTGIVLCKTDYVAFLDDRCRLGPQWLEAVRTAEHKRSSVIVGAYQKHEDGRVVLDHRL